MNLNLTCQKTHILAWANSDETLSLKINGVKYLGFPKVDKRGGKYWKVDSLITPSPSPVQTMENKKALSLEESYQAKVKAGKKMSEFSKAEIEAHQRWLEEQEKVQEIEVQSPKTTPALSDKYYEPTN